MSQSTIQIPSASRSARNWFFVGASLVGLTFWTNVEDPFNAPKSWVLYITAFWLLGWVAFNVKKFLQDSVTRLAIILSGALTLTFLASFIATSDKFTGFFGDYARRTGFLAYFCLIVFFLAGAMVINDQNIKNFDYITIVVGYIVVGYGTMQHFKLDPVRWNNPYNSVLSTLGNPDFAAAVIGIFAVLAFALAINPRKILILRLLAVPLIPLGLLVVQWAQVRQGLLAFGLGAGLMIVVWVYQRQKIVAGVMVIGGFFLAVGAVLGMLNMGPLTKYFYKVSVTYRGDYWRAGMRMLKSHPWFGVGLDRFGAYFTQYRDVTQATRLERGPSVHSNAAHNVPIQLAATGGIFLAIAFLAVTGFIIWRGIQGLRQKSGNEQMVFAGFFAAWVAYEAQTLISIDNLGIAIWGWVLGGIVVALSRTESPTSTAGITAMCAVGRTAKNFKGVKATKGSTSPAQPLVSYLLMTLAIVICLPLYLQDSALKTSRMYRVPTDSAQQTAYQNMARKALGYGIKDPHVIVSVAGELAQSGALQEGTNMAEALHKSNPLFSDGYLLLISIYEQTHQFAKVVPIRRELLKTDPFDYTNMQKLGEDLKSIGDIAGARALLPLIDAIAPSSPEAKLAHKDFGA